MEKTDIIELVRGYLGVLLITIDGCRGWVVTNAIINFMKGRGF